MAEQTTYSSFFVTPIGSEGSEERRHADMVYHAVVDPVCKELLKQSCQRADISFKVGMITDSILIAVMNADIVIADLSFLNPNVFYEIGVRHAVEKPIIHIASKETKLPFDNAGHNTIFFNPFDWHSQQAARKRLVDAIIDTRGADKAESSPILSAKRFSELSNSENDKDKEILELKNEISMLRQTNQNQDYYVELMNTLGKIKYTNRVIEYINRLEKISKNNEKKNLAISDMSLVMSQMNIDFFDLEEFDLIKFFIEQHVSLSATSNTLKVFKRDHVIPF